MSLGTPGASRAAKAEPTPEKQSDHYDFERLSTAVKRLVESHAVLEADRAELRDRLAERDARVEGLEAQVRDGNGRRQDAQKRLDQLILQVEEIEAALLASAAAADKTSGA